MSLATLKKKTQTKYNNMSVGNKHGFSLNGTHRSQGYIGQTSLSRSLPRTLAKGNTQRGHGGCCGTFIQKNPVISAVTSTEDPNEIKSSVLSSTGFIATHHRWIRRPQPFTTVKQDSNLANNTQQEYIKYLQQKTINQINTCDNTKVCNANGSNGASCRKLPSGSNRSSTGFNYTKPESSYVAMTQSEYLLNLNKKCTSSMVSNFYIPPRSIKSAPFACSKQS
jgi:hypothetical protein